MQRNSNSQKSAETALKRWFEFSGVFLLIVGIFLPVAKVPILGKVNFFRYASEAATILFIFAFISIVILIKGTFRLLWFMGSACTITIFVTVYTTYAQISEYQVKNQLEVGAVDLVMHALASKFHWDIGIFAMSLGVILLFVAAGSYSKTLSNDS